MKVLKAIVGRTVLVLTAILALFLVAYQFGAELHTVIRQKTLANLYETSQHYTELFQYRFNGQLQVLNTVSQNIVLGGDYSPETMMKIAATAATEGTLDLVYGVNESGKGRYRNTTFDISEGQIFKQAMSGSNTMGSPSISQHNGNYIVALAVPIRDGDQIRGVVIGAYNLDRESTLLKGATFYDQGYSFITTSEGAIVLHGDQTEEQWRKENIFDLFDSVVYEDYSAKQLHAAMSAGESGSFSFSDQGVNNLVSFSQLGVGDWYLFVTVPPDVMVEETSAITDMAIHLVLRLLGILLVSLMLLMASRRKHNKELEAANRRYSTLLANIEGGVTTSKPYTEQALMELSYVSDGFIALTGYSKQEVQDICTTPYQMAIHSQDRDRVEQEVTAQLAKGDSYQVQYRLLRHDESLCWVMDTGKVSTTEDGAYVRQSVITDISEMHEQQEELRLSRERFKLASSLSRGAIFEYNIHLCSYSYLENCDKIFGMPAAQFLDSLRTFSELPRDRMSEAILRHLYHPEDYATVQVAYEQLVKVGRVVYEARIRQADDSYLWARVHLIAVYDDNELLMSVFGHMIDIDEMKLQNEKLRYLAQSDALTGLYNKSAFQERVVEQLAKPEIGCCALFLVDIDNFKNVNDSLGHLFGDAAILEIAGKVKKLFAAGDIVGRVGGDEFAAFVAGFHDAEEIMDRAQSLRRAFSVSHVGENTSYQITCSVGAAVTYAGETDYGELFRRADIALYQSKANGKDCCRIYDGTETVLHTQVDEPVEARCAAGNTPQLNLRERIFELLYSSVDFSGTINMVLALVGQYLDASRVSIFENSWDNHYTRNSYEWCNVGVKSKLLSIGKVDLREKINFFTNFDDNGIFLCPDVAMLDRSTVDWLETFGVRSLLQVALMEDHKIRGFIGLDNCEAGRVYNSDEIENLVYAAKIISPFLFRRRANDEVYLSNRDKVEVLDHLPISVYVIDENYRIQYINGSTKNMLPHAEIGDCCYKILMNRDQVCDNCPARSCEAAPCTTEVYSPCCNARLLATASRINWSGIPNMTLVSCQDTSEIHEEPDPEFGKTTKEFVEQP